MSFLTIRMTKAILSNVIMLNIANAHFIDLQIYNIVVCPFFYFQTFVFNI